MNEELHNATGPDEPTDLPVSWQLEEPDTVEVFYRDHRTGEERTYRVRLTPGGTGD